MLSRRKKTVYCAIAIVAVAAAAEVCVRAVCWLLGRTPYTVATSWLQADDDLLVTLQPHYEGPIRSVRARINNIGLRGEDITTEKPLGTWRVLCLGDSRTFGYVVNQGQSYPAQLQRLFQQAHPDYRIEVINAGIPAYSAYQGLRFLELKGFALEPDAVTVAFGYNERRFVLSREQADSAEWFKRAARGIRWRRRLRFSYALLAMAKLARRLRGVDTWRSDVLKLPSQRLDRLHCRVDRGDFARYLRQIGRLCRDRGIAVAFIAMDDAPPIVETFRRGRRLRAQRRYEQAIKTFLDVGRDPPNEQIARWYRALALYEVGLTRQAQGKTTEALAAFRQSAQAAAFWSTSGGAPIRHSTDYVAIVRAVAAELRAPCVDLAAQLARRPELFVDHCHYSAEGHEQIARAILRCFVRNNLIGRRRARPVLLP